MRLSCQSIQKRIGQLRMRFVFPLGGNNRSRCTLKSLQNFLRNSDRRPVACESSRLLSHFASMRFPIAFQPHNAIVIAVNRCSPIVHVETTWYRIELPKLFEHDDGAILVVAVS